MRTLRWWQFGLFGGVVLSLATTVKLVLTVIRGIAGEAAWGEAAGFAVTIFGMGFLCGVIVWAGRGLYQWFGMMGDAIIGLAVMVCFFLSCMLLFDPEMLGPKFTSGGVPMFGLAVVVGLIGGAWTGHDVRKELAKQKSEQRGGDEEGNKLHT